MTTISDAAASAASSSMELGSRSMELGSRSRDRISDDVEVAMPDDNEVDEKPPETKKTCWGRVFKDWSQVPLSLVGGGCLGYSIYGFVTAQYALGGAAAVASLVCGVATVRITMLKPKRSLENNINFYALQNKKLSQTIGSLKSNIQKLDETKNKLKIELENTDNTVATLKENLKTTTTNLNDIAKKLTVTTDNLKTNEKLYQELKEGTKSIAENIRKLGQDNQTLNDTSSKIGTAVATLDNTEDSFSEEIVEFKKENINFVSEESSLKKLLDTMHNDIQTIETQYNQIKDDLGTLKKLVEKMDEADEKLASQGKILKNTADSLDQNTNNLLGELEEAEKLEQNST